MKNAPDMAGAKDIPYGKAADIALPHRQRLHIIRENKQLVPELGFQLGRYYCEILEGASLAEKYYY